MICAALLIPQLRLIALSSLKTSLSITDEEVGGGGGLEKVKRCLARECTHCIFDDSYFNFLADASLFPDGRQVCDCCNHVTLRMNYLISAHIASRDNGDVKCLLHYAA